MYSLVIIETDNEFQARIARIMLESAGYPSVAAIIEVQGERLYACFTSAPEGAPERYTQAINMYAEHGERGVEMAHHVAAEMLAAGVVNSRQVPETLRNTVRNALLHTLYSAAQDENSTVVFSDPAYSTLQPLAAVPEIVTDAPTAPVNNPDGGGFDGQCRGADTLHAVVDHDPGDEHRRPYRPTNDRYDHWTSAT